MAVQSVFPLTAYLLAVFRQAKCPLEVITGSIWQGLVLAGISRSYLFGGFTHIYLATCLGGKRVHRAFRKSPVMVLHWVSRESNYAVWNCQYRSVFEACCLSCRGVTSRGCACCVPALSADIDDSFTDFGIRVLRRFWDGIQLKQVLVMVQHQVYYE